MKRRDFIKTAGILAGASLLPGFISCDGKEKLPRFGLITGNTGGKWVENNPADALREIARLGYTDLEFGGSYGMEKDYLKSYLKELGLVPLIGPTSMQAMLDKEVLIKDIKACQEMGNKYIVCYWPWTDDGQNKTIDDWKRVADNLNKGGEICRREGLELLYHNHDIEFRPTERTLPFDALMETLDPACANIELDLYWITKGDQSATEYIRKYPGRYPVFHVKDMDHTPERSFECVGKGIIDFPSIFRLNRTAGAKHFIVEHDSPADPESCIRVAAEYLSGLRF